jgi:hypothetical protein
MLSAARDLNISHSTSILASLAGYSGPSVAVVWASGSAQGGGLTSRAVAWRPPSGSTRGLSPSLVHCAVLGHKHATKNETQKIKIKLAFLLTSFR